MDFRELRYIYTVAQEKNVTRAAEKLFMTQPTLSQAITRTEERVGYKIFTRGAAGLQITPRGERFIEIAGRMIQLLEEGEAEIQSIAESEAQQVVVGVPPLWSAFLTACVLPSFKSKFPKVDVVVKEAEASHLERMILHEDVQFAIMAPPIVSGKIEGIFLFREKILIAVSKAHFPAGYAADTAAAGYPRISAETLAEQRFILPQNGTPLRQSVDAFFQANGIVPKAEATTENLRVALHLADNNIGIAFIPEHFLMEQKLSPGLLYFTTDDDILAWKVVAAKNRSSPTTRYMQGLIKILKGAAEFNGNK